MKDYKDYHVGIIGSGLIGAGWATHLLIHGVREITLYDTAPQALDRAKGLISQGLAFFEENGAITAAQRAELEGLPVYTTVMRAAVEGADLILENGPENLELKRTILAGIEAECRDDAVITSSTSGIMISEIARDASHPERVIGAHPYLPVYLLPLVEIVISPKVGENYLNQALTFFRAVGKKPVVLRKNSPGYVGTRLMIALFRESAKIVSSGVCSLEDLDTAFTFGPGLRYALMGPYMVYQLTGGDGGFYLIDPNPGNIHESSFLDYAKLLQSLHGGYEFMMKTDSVSVTGSSIDFVYTRSAVYDRLYSFLLCYFEEHFTPQEVKSIFYHELVHWLRLMPYKLRKDARRAPMFYAGLVMAANDVYNRFEKN